MNRLTKRYNNGIVTLDADAFMETQETIDREVQNCYPAKKAVERLAEYEDAEESGLMVRLPCKVGDLLHEAGKSEIYTYIVDEIHVEQDSKVIVYALEYDADLHRVYQNGYEYDNYEFGKTVFLTREEAGKALEEDKQRAETEEV